ncbi:MAG: response regulator transcription factor [Actinomycetia bacterium]|nr:response regulator transcription factor [Actinomycetes bacterium]
MHMKTALLASDDVHSLAWMQEAIAPLDISVTTCRLADVGPALSAGGIDVVVIDAGRSPEVFTSVVERSASEGCETRLVLLVEREALGNLRLPVRVPSDFMVRGGVAGELAARVRALVWPGEERLSREVLRVEDLTVDLATYQVRIGTQPVEFTYLEYALFVFMLTHPNRVYSREVLLKRVWGTDYLGGARTVDVHVRRVRAKLGPEVARRLETVRNVGYLWRA